MNGERVANFAPQVRTLAVFPLRADQQCRARHGLVESGKERAQRCQRLAHRVAAQFAIVVGGVDRVRKSAQVAVLAQRLRRRVQQRTRQIETVGEGAPIRHAGQTLGAGAAKEREQHRLALVFGMMGGRDRRRSRLASDAGQRVVTRVAQRRFVPAGGFDAAHLHGNAECGADPEHDAFVLPRTLARAVVDVSELDAEMHARSDGAERSRERDGVGAAAARDEHARSAANRLPAFDRLLERAFRMRSPHQRRISRAISRCTSRRATSSRLSHIFLPRARPISTLAFPRVKYSRSGTIVRPFSATRL